MANPIATLASDIETLINKMLAAPNLDPAGRAAAIASYALDMATAIDKHIKSHKTSVESESLV